MTGAPGSGRRRCSAPRWCCGRASRNGRTTSRCCASAACWPRTSADADASRPWSGRCASRSTTQARTCCPPASTGNRRAIAQPAAPISSPPTPTAASSRGCGHTASCALPHSGPATAGCCRCGWARCTKAAGRAGSSPSTPIRRWHAAPPADSCCTRCSRRAGAPATASSTSRSAWSPTSSRSRRTCARWVPPGGCRRASAAPPGPRAPLRPAAR